MVIPAMVLGGVLGLAGPAGAGVDWTRAGGSLFGSRIEADVGADAGVNGEAGVVPALAPLSQPYGEAVLKAADRHGLDPKLLHAVVIVESAYRNRACSPAGAVRR